jgi:hypothetical protein
MGGSWKVADLKNNPFPLEVDDTCIFLKHNSNNPMHEKVGHN